MAPVRSPKKDDVCEFGHGRQVESMDSQREAANGRANTLSDKLPVLKRQLERIGNRRVLDLMLRMESTVPAGSATGPAAGPSDRPSGLDNLEEQMARVEARTRMLEDILRYVERRLHHVDGRSIDQVNVAALGWDIQRRLLDVEVVGSVVATPRPASGSDTVVERSFTLNDSGDCRAVLEEQIQDLTDELEEWDETISRCEAKMVQQRTMISQLQGEVQMKQGQLEAGQK
jgi:chaperonin cofactor prefoldin